MENVEIKGKKTKTAKNEKGTPVRVKKAKSDKPLSVVEADRSEPNTFLKSQINKMSKEQKAIAVEFMKQRNEARLAAHMEPAYSQEDMDLYN